MRNISRYSIRLVFMRGKYYDWYWCIGEAINMQMTGGVSNTFSSLLVSIFVFLSFWFDMIKGVCFIAAVTVNTSWIRCSKDFLYERLDTYSPMSFIVCLILDLFVFAILIRLPLNGCKLKQMSLLMINKCFTNAIDHKQFMNK